jgi:hypothetical protein
MRGIAIFAACACLLPVSSAWSQGPAPANRPADASKASAQTLQQRLQVFLHSQTNTRRAEAEKLVDFDRIKVEIEGFPDKLANAPVRIQYAVKPGKSDSPQVESLVKAMVFDFLQQNILDKQTRYEFRDKAAPKPVVVKNAGPPAAAPSKKVGSAAPSLSPAPKPKTAVAKTPARRPRLAPPDARTVTAAKVPSTPTLTAERTPPRAPSDAPHSESVLMEELAYSFPDNRATMTPESAFDIAYKCYIRGWYADAVTVSNRGLSLRNDARLQLIKGVCELHSGKRSEAEHTAKAFHTAVDQGGTYGLQVALERVNDPISVQFRELRTSSTRTNPVVR